MNYQLPYSILLSLALCRVIYLTYGRAASSNLPKLWKSDPSTKPDGFFRFFYRLEVLDHSEPSKYKSFLIEEWVHLRETRLRLDIVALPEGTRRTTLYYGDTGEVFYYKPFKCHTAAELNEALYPELVDIFPKNKGFYMKFGIGSLWKYVETLIQEGNDASSPPVSKKLDAFLPLEYDQSTSSLFTYRSNREYKFDLSFYMSDPNNVNTLSLIWIGSKYKLRIMDTPNELRQPRDQIEKVFQLPRGYGCVRSKIDGLVSPMPIAFMSLDPSELRLLRLDLVASRPIDDTSSSRANAYDSPDRWRSHSSSVRILSGGYRARSGDYERNYMIFEKLESSAERKSVAQYLAGITSNRCANVRRTKVVWDMSNLGSDSRSRYFELDASEGKCLGYGETKSPLDVSIDLHIAPASSDFESESPPLTLTLGVELLGVMFSPEGFHLISRTHKLADKEQFVFEKRDESFKMKNIQGQVIWEGPVSIVRQFVASPSKSHQARGNQTPGADDSSLEQHMITINFYSKNLDKLLSRVKLVVAELRAIDQRYLLDEIDVSTCLVRLGRSTRVAGAAYVDEMLGEQQVLDENLAFELEYYPLDADLYGKYATSQQEETLKKQIEMEFIRSLVEMSDYRLDLMQIINLRIDIKQQFESETSSDSSVVAKISGQLLDRPSLLNFIRDPGQRFSDGGGQQIRSLLKESAKGCAASCDHFNCIMFTYCSSSSVCDLLLGLSSKSDSGVKVVRDPNCVLFSRHDLARSIISSAELIYQMSNAIKTQQEQQPSANNPRILELTDGYSAPPILLAPEYIASGLLHGQELEELAELEEESTASKDKLISYAARRSTATFEQEYSLLIRDKKYKTSSSNNDRSMFPLAEAKHMSHHDCESLCKQNDCLSFSYCRLEKLCQISGLHRKEHIEPWLEQDSGCVVMARDYLTKFEKVSRKPTRPRQTFETIRVESLSECTTSCMEREGSPKCRSFYYCPTENGRASCHLKSNNMLPDTPSERKSNPIESVSNVNCDLYARSHLSDFDKFYGKSLPFPDPKTTASIHRGLEAEACASECADKLGECIGFQVCTMMGSNLGDFVCTIYSAALNSSVASRLEPSPSCTFFLSSPGSELYQLASNKLIGLIESAKSSEESATKQKKEEPEQMNGAGRLSSLAIWLLRIFFITVGLALGYGVIYGSRRSTLMRNRIRQISSSFSRF